MKITPLNFNDFGQAGSSWYHPSVTQLPDGRWLATMQQVLHADAYGEAVCSFSDDCGKNWSTPAVIDALRYRPLTGSELMEGVADIRTFTSPVDGISFTFGCSAFYTPKNTNVCWDCKEGVSKAPDEHSYYSTMTPNGRWSELKVLELPRLGANFRTACTQIQFLDNGEVLIPIYFSDGSCDWCGMESPHFAVTVARYRQKGDKLIYQNDSGTLSIEAGRGAIEPSIVRLADGSFALTIRAEDSCAYCSTSPDGTVFGPLLPWHWDDGTNIITSTTQQHWITLGDKTFLVFVMNDGSNSDIFRYRAPLYIAEADPAHAVLRRSTLENVFPRQRRHETEVYYGNFHCARLSERQALITDSALCNLHEQGLKASVVAALVEE